MDYPQALVSIVVLIICCLLGLPVWWNTTKVYRANLPHQQISLLPNTKFHIKAKIHVILSSEINTDINTLKISFLEKFQEYNNWDIEFEIYKKQNQEESSSTQQYCEVLQYDVENIEILTYQILVLHDKTIPDVNLILCDGGLQSSAPSLSNNSTSSLAMLIYVPETVNSDLSDIIFNPLLKYMFSSNTKSNFDINAERKFERRLPPSGTYRIVFTLAVADPNEILPTWDIESICKKHLQPILNQLNFLGPFSISSQVLYFADISLKPIKDSDMFYFTKSKLSLLINPLESRLNSYTSTDASLNFIVYIPMKKYSPLVIKTKKSDTEFYTAFHSPRWGGMQFFSPQNNSTKQIRVPMEQLIGTFIDQLKVLFGLTDLVDSSGNISEWSAMTLRIERTYEHLQKSISTLTSLSKLLDSIANIVIRDEIKILIDQSVLSIEKSKHYLSTGDIDKAYKHSKKAYLTSEQAFYDSSLLALLYFPDDQKYAIYVPLFVPIAMPLLISFYKAVRWLRNANHVIKEKEE